MRQIKEKYYIKLNFRLYKPKNYYIELQALNNEFRGKNYKKTYYKQ